MLVLFDHGTPRGLARELSGHKVTRAMSLGWDQLSNGELLKAAEDAGFQVLLTTDRKIRYQQNLAKRKIALVVLCGTTKWSRVRLCCAEIQAAIGKAAPGSYIEVQIPFENRASASLGERKGPKGSL
ncbi:MAG TPA: hypothetical protein VG267_13425 [Terracidiphilus sp.]|jgi:hypothetical protein|nr:hypothetical protein [Terracidiphilus sp.]